MKRECDPQPCATMRPQLPTFSNRIHTHTNTHAHTRTLIRTKGASYVGLRQCENKVIETLRANVKEQCPLSDLRSSKVRINIYCMQMQRYVPNKHIMGPMMGPTCGQSLDPIMKLIMGHILGPIWTRYSLEGAYTAPILEPSMGLTYLVRNVQMGPAEPLVFREPTQGR